MDGHLEFLTINLQLEMAEGQMIVWYDNDNVYVNLVLNPTCRFLGSYQGISIVTSHDPQFLEESGHLTTSEEFPKKWSKCVEMCKHDKMIAQFYGYLWWIMMDYGFFRFCDSGAPKSSSWHQPHRELHWKILYHWLCIGPPKLKLNLDTTWHNPWGKR